MLFQPSSSVLNEVFPFKEDAELHSKIVQLDVKYRIPLILSSFHELSENQIATILDCSPSEVEKNIQTAKSLLNGNHLEKRLEFLAKSYDRLPVLFNAEQIVGRTVSSKLKKRNPSQQNGSSLQVYYLSVSLSLLSFCLIR